MDETLKYLSRIGLLLGSLILFYLLVVFIGGVVQVAEAADRIYLGLGQPIFLTLLLLLVGLVASPLYIYFRFPKALVPPQESSGPEHEKFMLQLRKRLALNPLLVGFPMSNDADVDAALAVLFKEADQEIRKAAGAVFLATALSLNGKMDGLITLSTQIRMVWRIACIYHQRPSPRQMLYLYSNVAANALIAESIDDWDFSEVITPIVFAALAGGGASEGASALLSAGKGLVGTATELGTGIPGSSLIPNSLFNLMGNTANGAIKLVTNSIVAGTANAFLTLRVGCISNMYCKALSTPDKSLVRREATFAAAGMVGDIVKGYSVRIITAAGKAGAKGAKKIIGSAVNTVKGAAKATTEGAKSVAGNTVDVVKQGSQAVGEVVGSAGDIARSTTGKVAGSVVRGAQVVQAGIGSAIESSVQLVKRGTTRAESLPGTTTKPSKGNAE